jgi:MbtH protein
MTTDRRSKPVFEDDTQREYRVVCNKEEQYSVWPTSHALPLGWQASDKVGAKAECLAYIDEVWTDLRPLSVRRAQQDRVVR